MLEPRSFRRIKPTSSGLWMEILHGSSDVETEIEPDAERNDGRERGYINPAVS